ncbi:MAG: aminoacyl-tRNA hydrolase, partial [archaeon]
MSLVQYLVVRNDLKMGKGKIAAQCGHASILSFLKSQERKYGNDAQDWLNEGMKKIVVKVDSEKDLLLLFEKVKRFFPAALVSDAGHTQVEAGTKTCIGIGPAKESELQ